MVGHSKDPNGSRMRLVAIAVLAACQLGLSGCAAVMSVAAAHPAAVAAIVDFAPIAVAIGGIGAIGIAGNAGQEPQTYAQGSLGAALGDRKAATSKMVAETIGAGNEVAITAGLQAQRAVARARLAFSDRLAGNAGQWNAAETGMVAAIDDTTSAWARREIVAVKDGGDKVNALANALSVPAQVPQVRSYGPYYLFSFLPFQVITVRGSFPSAYPAGVVPRVTLNGATYAAHAYDAESVSFSVPTAALAPGESREILWTRAEVTVPWEHPIFDSAARAGYENFIVIGVLPNSAGHATISHRFQVTRAEERPRTSETYSLSAERGETEQTGCLTLSAQELADGWTIKPGSGKVVLGGNDSPAASDSPALDEATPHDANSICWRVRLATENGDAGALDKGPIRSAVWKISATLRRAITETRTESEDFDLAWGTRRAFAYPPHTWTIRYSGLGGGERVLTHSDGSNPLIRVEADSRGVRVSAYPF